MKLLLYKYYLFFSILILTILLGKKEIILYSRCCLDLQNKLILALNRNLRNTHSCLQSRTMYCTIIREEKQDVLNNCNGLLFSRICITLFLRFLHILIRLSRKFAGISPGFDEQILLLTITFIRIIRVNG